MSSENVTLAAFIAFAVAIGASAGVLGSGSVGGSVLFVVLLMCPASRSVSLRLSLLPSVGGPVCHFQT